MIGECLPDGVELGTPLRWLWSDPVTTIVTPRLPCPEPLAADFKLAELVWRYGGHQRKAARPLDHDGSGNCLRHRADATTGDQEVLDLEGEDAPFAVLQ